MKPEQIESAECRMIKARSYAERIMDGNGDGYDGADGAREVLMLCDIIDDLCIALRETTCHHPKDSV